MEKNRIRFNARELRTRKTAPNMKIEHHGGPGMNGTGNLWIKQKNGCFITKREFRENKQLGVHQFQED